MSTRRSKVLSGGERSRLATVQLLLEPYNLLLLDEPTNHLDIRSKEILKKALIKFDGTLIVVSHDRDFLDGLVDKVYEFRDKKIKTHLGGIAEFLRSRKIESLKELEKKDSTAARASTGSASTGSASVVSASTGSASTSSASVASASTGSASASSASVVSASVVSASTGSASVASASTGSAAPPLNSKERYLEKKETERVYRRLRRQAEESEAEITLLEKEIAEMNARLASGDRAVVSDPAFYASYEEKKKNLDVLMQRWETAHNELEAFTSDYMNGDANL